MKAGASSSPAYLRHEWKNFVVYSLAVVLLCSSLNQNSETEYGISWLPLGGYVKIAGMIDRLWMPKTDETAFAQRGEFHFCLNLA